MEELAEYISANFPDLSYPMIKPDKCGILEKSVSEVKRIQDGGRRRNRCIAPAVTPHNSDDEKIVPGVPVMWLTGADTDTRIRRDGHWGNGDNIPHRPK